MVIRCQGIDGYHYEFRFDIVLVEFLHLLLFFRGKRIPVEQIGIVLIYPVHRGSREIKALDIQVCLA